MGNEACCMSDEVADGGFHARKAISADGVRVSQVSSQVRSQDAKFTRRDRCALTIQRSFRGAAARRRVAAMVGPRPLCISLQGATAGVGRASVYALVTAHDPWDGHLCCVRRTGTRGMVNEAVTWESKRSDAGDAARAGCAREWLWLTNVPPDAAIVVSLCEKNTIGRDAIIGQASFPLRQRKSALGLGSNPQKALTLPLQNGDWHGLATGAAGASAPIAEGLAPLLPDLTVRVSTRAALKKGSVTLGVFGAPLWRARCGRVHRWSASRVLFGERGCWSSEWATLAEALEFYTEPTAEKAELVFDLRAVSSIAEGENEGEIKVAFLHTNGKTEELIMAYGSNDEADAWLSALRWSVLKSQMGVDLPT